MDDKMKYFDILNNAKNKAIEDDAFYLTGSLAAFNLLYSGGNIDYFLELFQEWDEEKQIPLEIGEQIEDLINAGNIIGIHRTDCFNPLFMESDIIKNICTIGLKNTGHLESSGAYNEMPSPDNTISFTENILNTMITLKTSYKNSNTAIVFSFPSEFIDKKGNIIPGCEREIYDYIDGTYYIKPEYILYIAKTDNNRIEFYPRDEFLRERAR